MRTLSLSLTHSKHLYGTAFRLVVLFLEVDIGLCTKRSCDARIEVLMQSYAGLTFPGLARNIDRSSDSYLYTSMYIHMCLYICIYIYIYIYTIYTFCLCTYMRAILHDPKHAQTLDPNPKPQTLKSPYQVCFIWMVNELM